ncbi:MAG: hypothetical protein HY313_07045 [Acidobacteria bacterium]|nr:hypothetical protein [Acidobacteriota bacterium]
MATLKWFDDRERQLAEWRKTFAPHPIEKSDLLFQDLSPVLLNQLYCRDLLRQVPEMVERTRKLLLLVLSEIKDQQSFIYLREAANCYILGLPQAAIALSRAAVEAHLRTAVSKHYGKKVVEEASFSKTINFAVRLRLLSPKGQKLVTKVKDAGDSVLHIRPAEYETTALDVLEAARAVILEMGGK